MEFKERLKDLRETKELTQAQLAKRLGVTRATISGYETKGNQPDQERLILLSDELEVSIDYLIRGEDIKVIYENQASHSESQLDQKVQHLYKQLSSKHKYELIEYMEYLMFKDKKRKKQGVVK